MSTARPALITTNAGPKVVGSVVKLVIAGFIALAI
jgi:hypothetical protein